MRIDSEIDLRDIVDRATGNDLSFTLQLIAEKIGNADADGATALCRVSKSIRERYQLARMRDRRRYYCMFCEGKTTVGDAPSAECKAPWEHHREDGTRYTPAPPLSLQSAVYSFRDEHFGLPWFRGVQGRPEQGESLEVTTRGMVPNGAVPETWCGFSVQSKSEVSNVAR